MKHFEQGNQTYLAVEVPEGYNKFYIEHNNLLCYNEKPFDIHEIELDSRPLTDQQLLETFEVKSTIIGLFPSLTEDECKEMVEKVKHNGGTDFFDYSQQRFLFTLSAKQSLASRLRSMGLNPETTLILKIK